MSDVFTLTGEVTLLESEPGILWLREARRKVAIGGRDFIDKNFVLVPEGSPDNAMAGLVLALDPAIRHRIRTSGDILTDAEIESGMALLRDADTVAPSLLAFEEKSKAHGAAENYALSQMRLALATSDAKALGRAYDSAKTAVALGVEIAVLRTVLSIPINRQENP